MRASMLQSEQQLKSAGSLFIGGSMQYAQAKGDSSFIPTNADYAMLPDFNRANNFEIGPSVGYGYTLVLLKQLFVTGTFKAQLNANFASGKYEGDKRSMVTIRPDYGFRLAAGYTISNWSLAATWINQNSGAAIEDYRFRFTSGSVRLSAAYRFVPGKKAQKILRPIDVVEEKYVKKLIKRLEALKPKI
jgi:hypothetical protein